MLFGRKRTEPFFAAWRDADPDGPMTVKVDPGQINGPDEAGIMVADWMRHLARALSQSEKAGDEQEALAEMRDFLRAELDRPSGRIEGSIEQ